MEKPSCILDRKDSDIYLEQIGGNDSEKSNAIIRSISEGLLPKFDGETRILDVGVGGGESIENIKQEIKDPKLILYGMDVLEPLARHVSQPQRNILSVTADLLNLPFKERSLSAINLSSVLHEALSYNSQIKEGALCVDDFLKSVFEKAIKILEVGGVLVYRDPGLISPRTQEKTFSYSKNIEIFVQNFHHDFSETWDRIIRDEVKSRINSSIEGVVISATNHYHREMQRHLITFLDLAFRQTVNLSLKQVLQRYENGQIGEVELINLTQEVSRDDLIYNSWFGREGGEVYTYRSLDEISMLLSDVKEEGLVDFDIVENFMITRPEYSAFLRMLSTTDIDDTKQNLFIRRTK